MHHRGSPRGRRAFSLIELMVCLCIIGVLATIAIPKYLGYRSRSMQAEVKIDAEALRTAENSYAAEAHSFTDDLSLLAFRPEGNPRYLYGFTTDIASAGKEDTALLAASGVTDFGTELMVSMPSIPLTNADLPGVAAIGNSGFVIGAVANLDDDSTLDVWTLDDTGALTHVADDVSQ